MAETFGFSEDGVRRIVRAVRKIEGFATPQSLRDDERPYESPPLLFRHDAQSSSDIVPPFGVMAVSGSTTIGDELLLITQVPTSVVRELYMVNGPDSIANGGYGEGYITGRVTVLYSTPPTTNFEQFGPTTGSWKLDKSSTQPVAQSLAVLRSSNVAGSSNSAVMEAIWLTPSSGAADVKVSATSDNSGKHWAGLHATGWNATTAFTSGKDFEVESEPAGSAPNQTIKLFIDNSDIPGYSAGAEQFLGKDTSDNLQWSTISAAGTDEKLGATSENSGVYWDGLHFDYNGSTVFNSTQDLKIESELTGTTPNQDIRLYADMSDINNWTGAGHQFFMTGANADLVWRNAENINVTTVYSANKDLLVEPELNGSNIFFFADMSALAGYSAGAQQFLTKDTSDVLTWSSGSNVDEKLAATSENSGDYWDQLHNEYNASPTLSTSLDLLIYSEAAGSTPNQTIRLYADLSLVSGYVATNVQFLHHSSAGVLSWVNATTCT